jgi:hypothetical protein
MRSGSDSRRFAAGFITIVAFLCGILVPASIRAQVVGATLSGTVTDSSGGVIPDAQISIKNTATGVTRTLTTNSDGFYTAPNLLPGTYEVTVSAPGFNREQQTGITLTVGSAQPLDFKMRVGNVSEKVQVTAEAPTVQLATSEVSATVNSTTVRELPLNGRSWTDLATLEPGVAAIQTQPSFAVGPDRGNRGFGAQVAISGARPQQNNYRLDGISLNDYANGAPGSVLGGNLGVDAIAEFSVLTSNYSAEYGKTSGGVVNAISRSGTNEFHGSAYEFIRNSALDARNYFDGTIPPFKRNQFGGAIGGPIRTDRAFFFVDYEGVRQSKGITNVSTVPSQDARNGLLCQHPNDPGATCTPSTVIVDSSAQKYLPFYPLPNPLIPLDPGGDTGTATLALQQVINENFVTGRIDYRFSDKDSIFGTYLFDQTPYHSPDPFNVVLLGSQTKRQIASVEETHVFGASTVNSVRFGYNRNGVYNDKTLSAINPLAADVNLGADPGRAASQVLVGGLAPFNGGVGANPTYFYYWNSYQVYDDASFTRAKHSVKIGGAVERMQLNFSVLKDPNGVFNFGSLSGFLTNNPTRFLTGEADTLTPRHLRQTLFGLYVQDDWRLLPNLTLNLGLRWEMTTVPTETNGKIANLHNITDPLPFCGVLVPGCVGTSPFFSNSTLRNFEPRIGFAWDPFRNGKTAVRGGFGMFDVLPLPYQFILLTSQAAPFFKDGVVTPNSANPLTPGDFCPFVSCVPPNGAFNKLGDASFQGVFIPQHPARNYVMQWTLNVQRELTRSVTAMVGYVGSRGVHQPFRADDFDMVLPTKTSAGYVWPFNPVDGTALNPINPNFGTVRGIMYDSNSFYDALEVGINKRLSNGFQVQGSFTWGKSIDNNSATLAGDAFSNSISSLDWFDLRLSHAPSDFNIGRVLVIDGTWLMPYPKSFSGVAEWATKGWQLGLIFKGSDGVPFTPTFGTDGDPLGKNSSDPWAFPNRLHGPGCGTAVKPGNPVNYIKTQCFAVPTAPTPEFYKQFCNPFFGDPAQLQCFNLRGNAGRNSLIGPGTIDLDFSIFKNNYIPRVSESFNVQFRVEIFNILNHANFAVPVTPSNTDIFLSDGTPNNIAGQLLTTTTDSRQIQFGLKVIF